MITFGLLNLLLNVLKQAQIFHLFSCFVFYAGGQFLLLMVFKHSRQAFHVFLNAVKYIQPWQAWIPWASTSDRCSSSVADVF